MKQMVITVIGDDRAGLVEALSGAIAASGGNWERSQLAELGGKFAGVVVVSLAATAVGGLTEQLDRIESEGLLHISMAETRADDGPEKAGHRLDMRLVGQDHPGIVHEISSALAGRGISIEELETAVVPAPMGGMLFEASAILDAPAEVSVHQIQDVLEALAQDLMVDLDLTEK